MKAIEKKSAIENLGFKVINSYNESKGSNKFIYLKKYIMRTIIFITGEANSGKSTIANQIISCGKSRRVTVASLSYRFCDYTDHNCDWFVFDECIEERMYVRLLNHILEQDELVYDKKFSSIRERLTLPNIIVISNVLTSAMFDLHRFSHIIDIHCKTK